MPLFRRRLLASLFAWMLPAAWGVATAQPSSPAAERTPPVPVAFPSPLPRVVVKAKFDDEITSQLVHAGESFRIETVDDARVGDVAIPRGTRGHGLIDAAEPAKGRRPAKLAISLHELDLADGRTLPIYFSVGQPIVSEGRTQHVGLIPVPLPGTVLLLGGGSGGGNVEYRKGAVFTLTTGTPPPTPLPVPSAEATSTR